MKRLIVLLLLLMSLRVIAQGDASGLIVLWDIESGEQILRIDRDLPVIDARLSPDGNTIIIQEQDGYRYVLNAADGEERYAIEPHSLISDADGYITNTHVVFWWSNRVDLHQINTGTLISLEHPDIVFGAATGRRDYEILTWAYDGKVRLWNTRTGRVLRTYDHLEEGDLSIPVMGAKWNHNETRLVTWLIDGRAMLWNTLTGERLLDFQPLPDRQLFSIADMLWSPDGNYVLAYAFTGEQWVWDVQTGELVSVYLPPASSQRYVMQSVKWAADSTRIISETLNGTLWAWEALSGDSLLLVEPSGRLNDLVTTEPTAISPYARARWNPDGSHFLSWGFGDNGAAIINVLSLASIAQPVRLFHAFPDMANLLDEAIWLRDGNRILSRTSGAAGVGAVWVWDINNSASPLLEGRICCAEFMGARLNMDETQVIAWGQVSDICGC